MTAPYPLELLVAKPMLDAVEDHTMGRHAEDAGRRYPGVPFRWNDVLDDAVPAWPHDDRLQQRVWEVIAPDEWGLMADDAKGWAKEWPFEVLFDEYHICARVGVYELWEQRAKHVDDIDWQMEHGADADRLADAYADIEQIDAELVGLALPLEAFSNYVDGLKSWFDGWRVVEHQDEDGEMEYDFVEGSRLEWDDAYDGWTRYDPDLDAACETAAAEAVQDAVQDAVRSWRGMKRIAHEGWTRALGSLFAEGKG